MQALKLSFAQLRGLEAVAREDVVYFPLGGHYRRRDEAVAVRNDTMKVLIASGLVKPPVAVRGPAAVIVEITPAGRAALTR
jgi:hypothetical protein